jgi:hypothetical protein
VKDLSKYRKYIEFERKAERLRRTTHLLSVQRPRVCKHEEAGGAAFQLCLQAGHAPLSQNRHPVHGLSPGWVVIQHHHHGPRPVLCPDRFLNFRKRVLWPFRGEAGEGGLERERGGRGGRERLGGLGNGGGGLGVWQGGGGGNAGQLVKDLRRKGRDVEKV